MRPEDLLARLEAGYEYDPMYGRLCNERDQLQADNAKLRELLLRSYESFEDVYDRCDIDDSWRMETALEDMRVCMRELGVEVNG